MTDLTFRIPTTVLYGSDSITRVPQLVGDFGSRAALVVDPTLYDHGVVSRIRDLFAKQAFKVIVFDETANRATTIAASSLVSLLRASQVQVLVAIGGMRTAAVARLAAVAVGSHMSVFRIADGAGSDNVGASLPVIVVPTAFRDHFALTSHFAVTEGTANRVNIVAGVPAKYAIIDPRLSLTLSPRYAAAEMMDMLLASIEGYMSSKSTFIADTLFLRAVDTIKEAVDGLLRNPDDPSPWSRASEAALLLSVGLTMSSQGIGGALTYAIAGGLRVPKAFVAAVLLPHVLDFHAEVLSEKVAKVARALGEDVPGINLHDDANQASTVARRLIGKLGLPGRLQDIGLAFDPVAQVAHSVVNMPMVRASAVSLGSDTVHQLVRQAF
jgi:alcohol dehydrogenase